MLIFLVLSYLLLTIFIGYRASASVKNVDDFIFAGRSLPLYLSTPALFATWFGAETVLGASAEFAHLGIRGIIEEPLGAALCLVLLGVFFAKRFYGLGYTTFGDFYREKYGKWAELISALLIASSYFGWIAAQFVALGVVLQGVLGIGQVSGVVLGALVVLVYTYVGGMWAISVTDFMQTVIIIVGLAVVCYFTVSAAGGLEQVIFSQRDGFFDLRPQRGYFWEYVAAWITIGLGSLPQQDVYQRVVACKTQNVAVASAYLGALVYLLISILPLLAALGAKMAYPELVGEDLQTLIPAVVGKHFGIGVQALFFGALISAIMSTASGASLAAATVLAENIVKPMLTIQNQKFMLGVVRICLVAIVLISVLMAISGHSIVELAASSSAFSLVSLFVPLVLGMALHKVYALSGLLSMVLGLLAWLLPIWGDFPSVIAGLGISLLGFVLGQVLTSKKLGFKG